MGRYGIVYPDFDGFGLKRGIKAAESCCKIDKTILNGLCSA